MNIAFILIAAAFALAFIVATVFTVDTIRMLRRSNRVQKEMNRDGR